MDVSFQRGVHMQQPRLLQRSLMLTAIAIIVAHTVIDDTKDHCVSVRSRLLYPALSHDDTLASPQNYTARKA